jgi:hypothetical protein
MATKAREKICGAYLSLAPSLIGKFHDMLCYLNTNILVGSTKLLTFSEHAY